MKNRSPQISVIMPCYNVEKYINKALSSIGEQTFSDFDVVAIDDASSDNTYRKLREFAQKDKRFKVFKNKERSGVAKTLNNCLAKVPADVKYIARMDGDDICLPNRFHLQWDYMEKNQSVDLLSTYARAIGNSSDIISSPCSHHQIVKFLMRTNNCLIHPTVFFRNAYLRKFNIRYNTDYAAEDYEMWYQVYKNGGKIAVMDIPLLKYRRHHGQVSELKGHLFINEVAKLKKCSLKQQ